MARLARPRHEVEAILEGQLAKGQRLLFVHEVPGSGGSTAATWDRDFRRWVSETLDALRACYSDEAPAEEFDRATRDAYTRSTAQRSWEDDAEHYRRGFDAIVEATDVLRALGDRQPLEPKAPGGPNAPPATEPAPEATARGESERPARRRRIVVFAVLAVAMAIAAVVLLRSLIDDRLVAAVTIVAVALLLAALYGALVDRKHVRAALTTAAAVGGAVAAVDQLLAHFD